MEIRFLKALPISLALIVLGFALAAMVRAEPREIEWMNGSETESAAFARIVLDGVRGDSVPVDCEPSATCSTTFEVPWGIHLAQVEASADGDSWGEGGPARILYPPDFSFSASCRADIDGDGYVFGSDIDDFFGVFNTACEAPLPVPSENPMPLVSMLESVPPVPVVVEPPPDPPPVGSGAWNVVKSSSWEGPTGVGRPAIMDPASKTPWDTHVFRGGNLLSVVERDDAPCGDQVLQVGMRGELDEMLVEREAWTRKGTVRVVRRYQRVNSQPVNVAMIHGVENWHGAASRWFQQFDRNLGGLAYLVGLQTYADMRSGPPANRGPYAAGNLWQIQSERGFRNQQIMDPDPGDGTKTDVWHRIDVKVACEEGPDEEGYGCFDVPEDTTIPQLLEMQITRDGESEPFMTVENLRTDFKAGVYGNWSWKEAQDNGVRLMAQVTTDLAIGNNGQAGAPQVPEPIFWWDGVATFVGNDRDGWPPIQEGCRF